MLLTIALSAHAAEVVWLEPPDDTQRARVAEAAGASGPALTPSDLRAASTRWSEDDDEAYRNLDAALESVREYESQLDGELVIMRDLEGPLGRIGAIQSDVDRTRLFAALAYQGFAVNRYFGDQLATDDEGARWRIDINGRTFERPWVDAVAIDPKRDVTPYDIAEAPQRVAYTELMREVGEALPGTLTPPTLPEGAQLVVDGRDRALGPSGNIKVVPGRHFVHIEVDGLIIEAVDVRSTSAGDVPLRATVEQTVWEGFLSSIAPGASVPAAVSRLVDDVGGDVWLAMPGDRDPVVLRVAGATLESVELPKAAGAAAPEARTVPGIEIPAAGVLAGWLSSGDFYAQDPANAPNERATVNAASVGGYATADLAVGIARVGAGIDVVVPLGDYHVALTGDSTMRVRPIPHVAAGLPWAQVTLGYLFPYHPAVGARGRVPVGPIEARVAGWMGLGTTRDRDPDPAFEALPVYTVTVGTGVSFR